MAMIRQSRPRVILTRPAEQAARFALLLAKAYPGAEVLLSPLMVPEFVMPALPDGGFRAVIFTSGTGVAAAPPGLPDRAYCVGAQTARAARDAGFTALSADGDAEALLTLIRAKAEPGPLLHLHGAETRGDLAARLTAAGIPTVGAIVYRQRAAPLTPAAQAALQGAAPVILSVFSPRSAALLRPQLQGARAPLLIAAISDAAASPLADLACQQVIVAARPDAEAMVAATGHLIAIADRLECGPPPVYPDHSQHGGNST